MNNPLIMVLIFCLVGLLMFLVYLNVPQSIIVTLQSQHEEPKQKVILNGKEFIVAIANTEIQRRQGLMYFNNLPNDEGMLFIMDEPTIPSFWMKNTLIPLDIIFINEKKEVISVHTAQPCTNACIPISPITTTRNVKYVLEINAGMSNKLNLKPGDKIKI